MYWEIFIVLRIDEVCLAWLETIPAECIDLLDPSFGADIFSFMLLKICLSYYRKIKYVKENVLAREFQESHENFSATFKWKAAGIESLEDLKIKIFREFEVVKCFKRAEIFLNNAANWSKILQFLTTNPQSTPKQSGMGKMQKKALVTL